MTLSWLHVDGIWIKDEDGNRIQLRGAGGDYYAYGGVTNLQTFVSWMKQTGCTCLRLAFCVPGHRVAQTEYDSAKMDYVLNLLEANGLYAILDCHHYWATKEVQGWDDVLPKYKQDWINCWVDIANRYKNRSVIAMYELDNEPYGSGGSELRNAYYECIDAIRATGDNHIVCCSIPERTWICEVEGAPYREVTWGNSSQLRPNMCLNIHNWHGYNPDDWFKDDESQNYQVAKMLASEWLATATYYRQKLGCPIVLGEFGTYSYDLNHPNVYDNALKIRLAEQLGHPWWAWMLDHWVQDAPTYWLDFVNQKLGAFASPYLAPEVPTYSGFDLHTFPALPFNIWARIDESQSQRYREPGYNAWGVCMVTVPQNYPVVFFGPCRLRVQVWSAGAYWSTLIKDYYIDLAGGETWTIGSVQNPVEGNTVVYAWEIPMFRIVNLLSSPSGVAIKVDGTEHTTPEQLTVSEGTHIFEAPQQI